jgi:hypothetical protein
MAAADPERGEAIARSIEDEYWRRYALARVAAAVAAADPERGEAIARSIEETRWRATALADIARLLAEQACS